MKVKFWGTRGSIAKAGPTTVKFGGNTSCTAVRSSKGTLVVLDCGTGAHGLGAALVQEMTGPIKGSILISHTHWDHIQGIPFFAPLFVPGCEWDIYAPRGLGHSLEEALAGQMQYTYFPIKLDMMGATIRYHELVEGTFQIDDVTVQTQYLNHPGLTLGYRLEVDGVSCVYSCDHEPFDRDFAMGEGPMGAEDERHCRFLTEADLVIHDAQYTPDEYKVKCGWGHTTIGCAVAMCKHAKARRVALTHHDPMRTDDQLEALVREAQRAAGPAIEVFAAEEGKEIDVTPPAPRIEAFPPVAAPDGGGEAADNNGSGRRQGGPDSRVSSAQYSALSEPQTDSRPVLVLVGDRAHREIVVRALEEGGLHATTVASPAEAAARYGQARPAMVVLDQLAAGGRTAQLVKETRAASDEHDCPLIVIGSRDRDDAGKKTPGVTDWLMAPFSEEYAKTRLTAWIFRSVCRWLKAPLPPDEFQRLVDLRALKILDTPDEERFDRVTRMASAAFGTPISLVSLVDENRQWFKSCVGLDARETDRDMAFCAHAVLARKTLVVPDTLNDNRFADNPLVTAGPRIRFYAGAPLILPSGSIAGTLCVIDRRHRELTPAMQELLEVLAAEAAAELARGAPERSATATSARRAPAPVAAPEAAVTADAASEADVDAALTMMKRVSVEKVAPRVA